MRASKCACCGTENKWGQSPLEDSESLRPPEVIAQEVIEDLEAAVEQLRAIAGDLGKSA
jgi:type I restriction enzyme M protein